MKIPVTGFEPFRPDAINAAREAVSRPPDAIGGAEILKRQLPVEYEARPGPAESQRRGISPQPYPLPPDGDHQGLPPWLCCCEQVPEKPFLPPPSPQDRKRLWPSSRRA